MRTVAVVVGMWVILTILFLWGWKNFQDYQHKKEAELQGHK